MPTTIAMALFPPCFSSLHIHYVNRLLCIPHSLWIPSPVFLMSSHSLCLSASMPTTLAMAPLPLLLSMSSHSLCRLGYAYHTRYVFYHSHPWSMTVHTRYVSWLLCLPHSLWIPFPVFLMSSHSLWISFPPACHVFTLIMSPGFYANHTRYGFLPPPLSPTCHVLLVRFSILPP